VTLPGDSGSPGVHGSIGSVGTIVELAEEVEAHRHRRAQVGVESWLLKHLVRLGVRVPEPKQQYPGL
jgi:hypothetical protein